MKKLKKIYLDRRVIRFVKFSVFIAIIMLLSLFFSNQKDIIAHAEGAPIDNYSITQKTQAWYLLNGLLFCSRHDVFDGGDLQYNHVEDGKWWDNDGGYDNVAIYSYLARTSSFVSGMEAGDNGHVRCTSKGGFSDSKVKWITNAVSFFGFGSPIDFLCQDNMLRKDGADISTASCKNGDRDDNTKYYPIDDDGNEGTNKLSGNKINKTVADKIYGGDTTKSYTMTDDMRYEAIYQSFFFHCLENRSEDDTTDEDVGYHHVSGKNYFVYEIKVYDKDSQSFSLKKYVGRKDDGDNYPIFPGDSQHDNAEYGDFKCNKVEKYLRGEGDLNIKFNGISGGSDVNITASGDSDMQSYKTTYQDLITKGIDPEAGKNVEDEQTTCAIEGVGWIICPVVRFLSKVADYSYGFISKNFLVTEKSLLDNTSTTKTVWNSVVSLANIIFVVAFLIIIFSQLTSVGITNYGIKKMLPKLIIAIILVNLSFYICQIAVDISNIVGASINKFIEVNMVEKITDNSSIAATSDATNGTGFAGIAGVVLMGAGVGIALWASLTALIPIVISAIIAAIMILFILSARKAIIVILVIISPLAFVAYLLPNTEGLFKKWKKAFISLLMVYPIIAFVFAGSKLTSTILSTNMQNTTGDGGEVDDAFNLGQIIAAGIRILPLFIVPGLLKKSLDGIGGIGAKISGIGDKLGKSASNKYTNSKFNKNWEQGRATKKAMIEGGQFQGSKFNPNTWRSKAHGAFNRSSLSGRYGNVVEATGASVAAKQNKEDVDMAGSQLENLNLDKNQLRDIAMGKDGSRGKGNIAMQQAAIKQMVATNDVEGMNALWDDLDAVKADPKSDTREAKLVRNTFAESLLASSGRPAWFGAGAIAGMRTRSQTETKDADGNIVKTYDQQSSRDTIVAAVTNGAYSADKIARGDKDEISALNNVLENKDGKNTAEQNRRLQQTNSKGYTHIQQVRENAKTALEKETTSALISKNREEVIKLSEGNSRVPTPPPAATPAGPVVPPDDVTPDYTPEAPPTPPEAPPTLPPTDGYDED